VARHGFFGRIRDAADAVRNVADAARHAVEGFVQEVRNPSTYAPPPIQPAPPPARPPGPPGERPRPPRVGRQTYVPRGDMPADWGRNEVALWRDATLHYQAGSEDIAHDETAQALYDAALYTFSETHEDRAAILANLRQYIEEEYGIDWDDIFDWEGYREAYDRVAT
jgi:hypothetical protein